MKKKESNLPLGAKIDKVVSVVPKVRIVTLEGGITYNDGKPLDMRILSGEGNPLPQVFYCGKWRNTFTKDWTSAPTTTGQRLREKGNKVVLP